MTGCLGRIPDFVTGGSKLGAPKAQEAGRVRGHHTLPEKMLKSGTSKTPFSGFLGYVLLRQ